MHNTGIVILAAGSSSRLGGIKQLLVLGDKTLLQHVIAAADAAGLAPIVVVIGAHAVQVEASIAHLKIELVYNTEWATGKASGIVAGVQQLLVLNPQLEKVILSVCDQPFVSAELFTQLVQTQTDTGKHIVASAYAGTVGTPVLFTQAYFEQLLRLQKDEGAKKLLQLNPAQIAMVDFPEGSMDIDTLEDYSKISKNWSIPGVEIQR